MSRRMRVFGDHSDVVCLQQALAHAPFPYPGWARAAVEVLPLPVPQFVLLRPGTMVVPSRPGGANHLEGSGGGYRRDMVLGSLRNCNPRTNAIRVFGCPDGPHEQHFIS